MAKVEQIDREIAASRHLSPNVQADMRAGLCDDWEAVQSNMVARTTERARILAALREPDAAMVAVVKSAIMQAVRDNLTCTATAALAAAADHMETRDAG